MLPAAAVEIVAAEGFQILRVLSRNSVRKVWNKSSTKASIEMLLKLLKNVFNKTFQYFAKKFFNITAHMSRLRLKFEIRANPGVRLQP